MASASQQILDPARSSLREKVEMPGVGKTVPIEHVEPNDWNVNEQSPGIFAREKESLKLFGFVVPVVVRPKKGKSGFFEIIDGEHRWKAAHELHMQEIPIFDIGPIGDHEAEQLSIILNELKGKPNEDKLAASLRKLLAKSTIDDLVRVLPYSKDQFAKIAKLPDFDWDALKAPPTAARRWVERIFRLAKEDAEQVDAAIARAKEDHDDMTDSEALGAIAGEFLK